MNNMTEQRIASITVEAKLEYLPAVMSFVRGIAANTGLSIKDIGQLELAVEEACVNTIQNSFDYGEQGTYDVSVLRRPGQVVVTIEDQGLPFDIKKFNAVGESDLGVILMKAFADEIRFSNLGRRGKQIELIKNLPYKTADIYLTDIEKEATSTNSVPANIPITVRMMNPDDAINLARCVYRCYGYTYGSDHVYFPERVCDYLLANLMTSVVSIAPDGEIIGHTATLKPLPDARVGETGQAIVDPRYRGFGILNRMGDELRKYNKDHGLYGYSGEAVTVHTYTQKASKTNGASETGIFIGFVPPTMYFKAIQEEKTEKRRAVVQFFNKLNPEPVRNVYPPLHHRTIIQRIYENLGLKRNILDDQSIQKPPQNGLSRVDIKIKLEAGHGYIQVAQFGNDLEELVKFRLKELCLRHIECIYIDLPLSDPYTQTVCASLEMMGFFFGGIMPEMTPSGDLLRLQYLNNADIDMNPQIYSEFGKELYNYVLKAGGLE
ncbi:MAG: ATP-binding protein [Chloroflexi bacterium]|nr:ATP-binding protein [Chloroflexota bacterium]